MAEKILTNASILVDGNDVSDHVKQVTINYKAEMKDKSAMGDSTRVRLAGVLEWDVALTFNNDWAAGQVESILFPLVGAAAFPVIIKPDAGAVTTSNPSYSGNAVIEGLPLGGSWGDLAETATNLMSAGDLTRATA